MNLDYQRAGLVPLLEQIRSRGRYLGKHGVNVLTNATDVDLDRNAMLRELQQKKDLETLTQFEQRLDGLSYGLNPYTDWSLAQLRQRPDHWYLFLGLDWYSVADLSKDLPKGKSWVDYLDDPFIVKRDFYWRKIWAWILNMGCTRDDGRKVLNIHFDREEAAAFVRKDCGGFLFHNLIPYLRPASEESSGTHWPEKEWKKPGVRRDSIKDLELIRLQTNDRIVAFCTGEKSANALEEAGFRACRQNNSGPLYFNWGAHPSQPSFWYILEDKNLWFRGRDYFQIEPA